MKRILDWLNGEERDPILARRLWQDLSNFAEILVQVSHRQELRDHDLRLLIRAYRTLFPSGARRLQVPEDLLSDLKSLLGLDDELDRLIMGRPAGQVELWRRPLQRLKKGLRHGSGPPPNVWQELDLTE